MLACAISALVASLVNTFLVMSGIYLFFGESYAAASNTVFSGFFKSISLFIGTVGVPEAIVAAVLATVIARPLITILQKGK